MLLYLLLSTQCTLDIRLNMLLSFCVFVFLNHSGTLMCNSRNSFRRGKIFTAMTPRPPVDFANTELVALAILVLSAVAPSRYRQTACYVRSWASGLTGACSAGTAMLANSCSIVKAQTKIIIREVCMKLGCILLKMLTIPPSN